MDEKSGGMVQSRSKEYPRSYHHRTGLILWSMKWTVRGQPGLKSRTQEVPTTGLGHRVEKFAICKMDPRIEGRNVGSPVNLSLSPVTSV